MMAAPKAKRIYCFICGNVKGKEEENCSLFRVPKDKLEQWRLAIGSDKLQQTSRLCDAHFLEVDVIKGKMILGSFFPEKHHLKKDVVPKLLLGNEMSFIHLRSVISVISLLQFQGINLAYGNLYNLRY